MIKQVEDILRDVRVCLDQNEADNALISNGDEETLMLDDIIRSKILESVDSVHLAAPYWMLEQGHNLRATIHWEPMECGYTLLPDDFLRLVVFEMSDWERPVHEAISTLSPEYKLQRSRIKALRGTAQRPVCAIGAKPFGKVLEFYSCKTTNATVSRAVYIPIAEIDANDGVDISEQCYAAVVYTVAAATLTTMGETQQAAALVEQANNLLQIAKQ